MLNKRIFLFLAAFTSFTLTLQADPTHATGPKNSSKKTEKKAMPQETVAQSANGWTYVKNEWVHPDGYKFANGKVLRTTARLGKSLPKPPGKLALENPQQLTPKTAPVQKVETAADVKRKNLEPRPAPQTGSHL